MAKTPALSPGYRRPSVRRPAMATAWPGGARSSRA
eukprot:gene35558-47815_t